ncbi:MAG: hypothetical protein D6685_14720 [Bacteroidetes bacterium]|nr:MAG: hypothetical protein D6685_14720 [Bacteroidota bacterium]
MLAAIGKGAQGTVYLCVCTADDECYAVKAVDRSQVAASVLRDHGSAEVDAMVTLRHPHVVRLHEVIDDPAQDCVFLVVEYVDGKPVGTVNAETGVCVSNLRDEAEFDKFVTQQLRALRHLHARGVVHGDVKVDNILVTRNNQPPPPSNTPRNPDTTPQPPPDRFATKLCDFGVATLFDTPKRKWAELSSTGGSGTMSAKTSSSKSTHTGQERTPLTDGGLAMAPVQPEGPRPANPRPISPSLAASPHRRDDDSPTQNEGYPQAEAEDVSPVRASGGGASAASALRQSRSPRPISPARAQKIQGTPHYLSPERFSGEAPSPASGLWALGVTMYALVYGRLPFTGGNLLELSRQVSRGVVFPASSGRGDEQSAADRLAARWQPCMQALLSLDPDERWKAYERMA